MGTSNLTLAGRLAHFVRELDPRRFAGHSRQCDCGHFCPGKRAHDAGANDPANPGRFGRGCRLWRKAGAITLALYALEGAAGLPVFANFQAGLFLPTGEIIATGGFIIGFIAAAGLVGYLVEKGWGANVFKLSGAMLLGAAIVYVPGLIWLVGWLGVMKGMDVASAIAVALTTGLFPFIFGDIIKAVLAALAFPAAFSLLGRR